MPPLLELLELELELLEPLELLDKTPLDDALPELALDPELPELDPEMLASPLLVPLELLDPLDPVDPPELAELAELPKPPELIEPPEAPPLPLEAADPESSPPPEDALPPPPQPAGEISAAAVARPRAPKVDSETRSLR